MESSLRNTAALVGHVNKLERQLVSRYLNIVSLARLPQTNRAADEEDDETRGPDRNQAAYNTLKMDVETTGLIRAAEDILALTRQMKELWLFGQLHALGTGSLQKTAEDDAAAVGQMLGQVFEDLYSRDDTELRSSSAESEQPAAKN